MSELSLMTHRFEVSVGCLSAVIGKWGASSSQKTISFSFKYGKHPIVG